MRTITCTRTVADSTHRMIGTVDGCVSCRQSRPAAGERVEASRWFLIGFARCDEAVQLVDEIVDLLVRNNTFPCGVVMEPAADALEGDGVWQLDIASPDLGGTVTFVVDDASDWRARWNTISVGRRLR